MNDLEERLRSNVRLTSTRRPPTIEEVRERADMRRERRRHVVAGAIAALFIIVVGASGAVAIGFDEGTEPMSPDQLVELNDASADPCGAPPPPSSQVTTTLVPAPTPVVDPLEAWWDALPGVASEVFGDRFAGLIWVPNEHVIYVKRYEDMPLACGGVSVVPVAWSLTNLQAEQERIDAQRESLAARGIQIQYLGIDLAANLVGITVSPLMEDATLKAIIGEGPFHIVEPPDHWISSSGS